MSAPSSSSSLERVRKTLPLARPDLPATVEAPRPASPRPPVLLADETGPASVVTMAWARENV